VDAGKGSERVPIVYYQEPVSMRLNAKYIADWLHRCESDDVKVSLRTIKAKSNSGRYLTRRTRCTRDASSR